MKLTGLVNDGVKGRRGASRITPITMISGPNGAGKTTHLLAIAETVNGSGRFPWLADVGQAADRADGALMVSMALQFMGGTDDDDGLVTLQREVSPNHNASVSPGPMGLTKVKDWIASRLACGSLDVLDFLHLSPGQREAALLGVVGAMPADWTAGDTLRGMLGLVTEELEEHAGEIPGDGASPVAWSTWLAAATKAARSRKLHHGRTVKSMEAELSHAAVTDDDAALVGTLDEAIEAKRAADEHLRDVQAEAKVLAELGGSVDDARAGYAAMGREIAELTVALERHDAAHATALKGLTAARQEASAIAQADHEKIGAARALLDRAQNLDNSTRARRLVAAAEHRTHQLAREAVAAYRSGAPCTECGQPVDTECDGYTRAVGRMDEAERRAADADVGVLEAEEAEAAVRLAIKEVGAPSPEAYEANRRAAAALGLQLEAAINAAAKARAAMDGERTGKLRARAGLEAALERAPQAIDPAMAAAQLAGALQLVQRAEETLQRHNRAQAREEERADKLRRKMDAADRVTGFAEALDRVCELRAELTRQTAGRVLSDAQDLFGRVFTGQLVTTDDPKGGARLALERDGLVIPAEAWSDSETLIAGLAFHLTMQRASGARWKVALVDNVDRLTPETLAKLIGGLVAWHEMGAFDNVIMAGALPYELPSGSFGPLVSAVTVAA